MCSTAIYEVAIDSPASSADRQSIREAFRIEAAVDLTSSPSSGPLSFSPGFRVVNGTGEVARTNRDHDLHERKACTMYHCVKSYVCLNGKVYSKLLKFS